MVNRDVIWPVEFWLFKMTCVGVRCTTITGNQSDLKFTIKENVQQTHVCRTLFKTHFSEGSVGYSIPYFFPVTNTGAFQLGPFSGRGLPVFFNFPSLNNR